MTQGAPPAWILCNSKCGSPTAARTPGLVKIQDLAPGLARQEPVPDQDTRMSLVQANRRPGNLHPLHTPASNVLWQLNEAPTTVAIHGDNTETSQSHFTQLSSHLGASLALAFSEDF